MFLLKIVWITMWMVVLGTGVVPYFQEWQRAARSVSGEPSHDVAIVLLPHHVQLFWILWLAALAACWIGILWNYTLKQKVLRAYLENLKIPAKASQDVDTDFESARDQRLSQLLEVDLQKWLLSYFLIMVPVFHGATWAQASHRIFFYWIFAILSIVGLWFSRPSFKLGLSESTRSV